MGRRAPLVFSKRFAPLLPAPVDPAAPSGRTAATRCLLAVGIDPADLTQVFALSDSDAWIFCCIEIEITKGPRSLVKVMDLCRWPHDLTTVFRLQLEEAQTK